MKNTLILLFIILVFSCQGSDWGDIRYTHSKTNVRKLKSTSSKIVTTLQPNQKIRVIVSEYDWWLVYDLEEKKKTRKNAIGYVHKSLLHSTPVFQKVAVKKPPETKATTPKLKYTIVEREDVSYLNTPRMVYHVILNVDVIPNEKLIEEVATYLWENGNRRKWSEFTVFLYLPNMNINGLAYGIAEFTPIEKKSFEINDNTLSKTKWADYVKQGEPSSSTSSPKHKLTPAPQQKSTISYKIQSEKDLSFVEDYRMVKRTQFKVLIDRNSNEQELKSISKEIIENLISKGYQNAVTILYYLPNTNTNGHYTAGMVDWAPYGDWGKSNKVLSGDYSKHDYKIIVGGVMGEIVEPTNTTVSEKKRKEIFYNLVKLQDIGFDSKRAYKKIAKKYDVDVKLVEDIVMEGLTKNWRMP